MSPDLLRQISKGTHGLTNFIWVEGAALSLGSPGGRALPRIISEIAALVSGRLGER